jgi:ATP-dependent DNA helicase DinG
LGALGSVARAVDEFRPRSGQATMAHAVAVAMQTGGTLVVEAGTGVGKTYAYLVPALLSGGRVLLSTATKTLQDQLYWRDIPRLTAALGVPARTAMLKGRSSYLCMQRLGIARHDVRAIHPTAQAQLARIEQWSLSTRTGDLAELPEMDDYSPVIALVTSTRDNCIGSSCPQVQTCHVNQARRDAMAADIVVINHHLFFADLQIRESGVAELLPSAQSVVFDEAHQLNEIGVQFYCRKLSLAQLDRYALDLGKHGHLMVQSCPDWASWVVEVRQRVGRLQELCTGAEGSPYMSWSDTHPADTDEHAWSLALAQLHTALQQCEVLLRSMEELFGALKGLREHTALLMAELDVFSHPLPSGWIRWIETGRYATLVQSPRILANAIPGGIAPVHSERPNAKSWIFTSATLGHDATLTEFLESGGLQHAQVLQVASPFDYAKQAAIFVPPHFPGPSDVQHRRAVANLVVQIATTLGGRTLVLTTTLRAMREIAELLRHHILDSAEVEVLVQGESSKRELTERLRKASPDGHVPGIVLVASVSFWEGVDVPGDALQVVVIDKLPFPPPDSPLVAARSRQIEEDGRKPFQHLYIPHAAVALKQGAGRLIRHEKDRGILVVCDVRLIKMGYGRRLLAALPPMKKIETQEAFMEALEQLTRPSTTGH